MRCKYVLCVLLLSGNALAEAQLHLYNWNNYISDQTVLRFERQCACRVVQDYYSDNEEMLAKLAAGATGYDIIVPTGNAMESLIRQNALRPLDKSRLPNLKNINPAYLDTPFDPGNRFSVPYAYTVTLIGFNVEKMRALKLPVDSWAVIFEPQYLERIKGRVTVLDSQRELIAAALMYLGYPANDVAEAHWRSSAPSPTGLRSMLQAISRNSLSATSGWYRATPATSSRPVRMQKMPGAVSPSPPASRSRVRCWHSTPWCCIKAGRVPISPFSSSTSCWPGAMPQSSPI